MKILVLSYHPYPSRNRAGFHHLAKAFARLGHDTTFVTTGPNSSLLGYLLFLPRDPAVAQSIAACLKTGLRPGVSEGVRYTAHIALSHIPNRFPFFNGLFPHLSRIAYCKAFREPAYDAIMVESSQALMLVPYLKRRYPGARLIYRVSDDLEQLGYSRYVVEGEKRAMPSFTLSSCPSTFLVDKLRRLSPAADVRYHEHGIWKSDFTGDVPSPYAPETRNAVFIGVANLDADALTRAAVARPNVDFHIFGNRDVGSGPANLIRHGIVPFKELVPYILHADLGLQLVFVEKNMAVLEKTLKIVQYTWCRLPILAPASLNLDMAHVFKYGSDPESMGAAIDKALASDRSAIDRSWILDWTELAALLLRESDAPG